MRPAARVQAAIELLDAVIAAACGNGPPADRLIAEGFRQRRYAGSKDRRAIRELVYGAIRACGPIPEDGRAAMLRLAEEDPALAALFDGSDYGPQPLAAGEQAAAGGLAPLDLRVNRLKADRDTLELPAPGEELAAPGALRFPPGTAVEQWDAYRGGAVEIQDHGSQLACLAVDARPGETVIDLCAGGGGKSGTPAGDSVIAFALK